MIISCKMAQCPYHDVQNFCIKSNVVGIDQMGMCSVLWRRGQQRMLEMPFTDEKYPKQPIIILDVAENEITDVIEEEEGEETESRLENPTNGAAAFQDEQSRETKNDENSRVQEEFKDYHERNDEKS